MKKEKRIEMKEIKKENDKCFVVYDCDKRLTKEQIEKSKENVTIGEHFAWTIKKDLTKAIK